MRLGIAFLVVASAFCLFAAGCARAPSNVQTLVSDNCGSSWRLIPVGGVVPTGMANACFMKVAVPNYPMVGESTFTAVFSNRVRVTVNSSYDYTIIDAMKFITEARFITRQGSIGDETRNGANVWDSAESILIDRRLRELANSPEFLLSEDIVEFNQGEFEDRLLTTLNANLAERGVQLNTFTFVVTPDDQTRNMIDVAAALRVCESIDGLDSMSCRAIITARAGATRVTVSTNDITNQN